MKYRIEECNNGFMVVVQEGKDQFAGRYVFIDAASLLAWLTNTLTLKVKP